MTKQSTNYQIKTSNIISVNHSAENKNQYPKNKTKFIA